ncbi:MAG: hypothetical protein GEU74_16280, partial [Nitriliruptorales bacterium]|nr:hypothetical protein [Nitriliruptorales bacterium]
MFSITPAFSSSIAGRQAAPHIDRCQGVECTRRLSGGRGDLAGGGTFAVWSAGSALLGAGTARAHPTLIAAVADVAHPSWCGAAVGASRLWRDLAFAVGAHLTGALADLYSIPLVPRGGRAASGDDP